MVMFHEVTRRGSYFSVGSRNRVVRVGMFWMNVDSLWHVECCLAWYGKVISVVVALYCVAEEGLLMICRLSTEQDYRFSNRMDCRVGDDPMMEILKKKSISVLKCRLDQ